MLPFPSVVDLAPHGDDRLREKLLGGEDLLVQWNGSASRCLLRSDNHGFQVFFGEPLDHPDDPIPLVFHEADEGPFAPPEVHDPHRQNKGNQDGADKADGQRLEKGAVETGGLMLPDDLLFRTHHAYP